MKGEWIGTPSPSYLPDNIYIPESYRSGGSSSGNSGKDVDGSPDISKLMSDYLKQVQSVNAASNALQVAEAQKNRDFQAAMSNTSHQREVLDLKAAGLNPVLSANNGAPMASGSTANISDPSGSMASLVGASISALTSIANTQANNAKDLAINKNNLDLQEKLGLRDLDLREALGLAGLELDKYGIDVGHQNTIISANASNYAANISKLNTELSNNAAYERLVEQGKIDLNKITTKADADILVNIFKGEGFHGELSYLNRTLAASYLVSKGILKSDGLLSIVQGSSASSVSGGSNRDSLHHTSDAWKDK